MFKGISIKGRKTMGAIILPSGEPVILKLI
jgi:hypothetical protein